ncbi:hypothetical protein [Amycolatopsis sp. NBC_01480]|nr:hypothetical protein [Amycolatopsis sp. NBC_01480]
MDGTAAELGVLAEEPLVPGVAEHPASANPAKTATIADAAGRGLPSRR